MGEGIAEASSRVDFSASSWERQNLRVKGSRLVDSEVAATIIPPLGREEVPERYCVNQFMRARS